MARIEEVMDELCPADRTVVVLKTTDESTTVQADKDIEGQIWLCMQQNTTMLSGFLSRKSVQALAHLLIGALAEESNHE